MGMDGGTELSQPTQLFLNNKMNKFLEKHGTNYMVTTLHSPWLNACAERTGTEITKMARTAIVAAKLGEDIWSFAEETAVHTLNQLPTKANPNFESPHKRSARSIGLPEHDCLPQTIYLRTFGCRTSRSIFTFILVCLRRDYSTRSGISWIELMTSQRWHDD
jgi:hypothetical protein